MPYHNVSGFYPINQYKDNAKEGFFFNSLYNKGGKILKHIATEVVDAPCLETFKVSSDRVLSNLSLLIAGYLG